jgi:hypothetical protein
VPAAVVADVDDQAVLRQRGSEPDELVAEGDRVGHAEGEDAQVAEGAVRGDHLAGAEDAGHRRRQVRGTDCLRFGQLGRALALLQFDDLADVERFLGARLLVGVQVETHRRRGRGERVEIGHRRQVGRHLPLLAQFPGGSVEAEVAQDHPGLVRR